MEEVHKDNECLQASATVQTRSSLFRDVLQCRCLVSYWSVETSHQFHLQGRMGVIDCPEMSVLSFQFMLQNILEERSSQVHINFSVFFFMTDDTLGGPVPSRTGADNKHASGARDGGRKQLEGCRATLP